MIQDRAFPWLKDPYFDRQTRQQVEELWNQPSELENAFFADLKFGTGGLRAVMGVGTYRMNIYTIRKATQALANYIRKKADPRRGVVIGYDSRHHSKLFAQEAARTLAGNQIPVFICQELRPTPFVSFACRHLQTQAGIMITASHNPKEYNGYKVYWDDGAQIVSPHDQGIMEEMELLSSYTHVKVAPLSDPLIQWLGETVDHAYLDTIAALPIFKSPPHPLRICYSSLHGAGITLLPAALQRCGFDAPQLVTEQCTIDGDFPTAASPNPESSSALTEGIRFLTKTKSDILLVTDPDADRIGVVVSHRGKAVILNGHELATLSAYYLCNTLRNQLTPKSTIVTTVVTTPLIDHIAKAYHVKTIRVLTGFKYIGEKMREWDTSSHNHTFLFGAEESHGYLIGTYCRDKDGISASCLFAQMASELKSQGKTCVDLLHEIYARFGVFQEKTISLQFSNGKEGIEAIQHLMQSLRKDSPPSLIDQTIIRTLDYLHPIDTLPRTNMLQWTLEDGSSLLIRPSGTEPKLKVYLSTHRPAQHTVETTIADCQESLHHLSTSLQTHLEGLTARSSLQA